MSIMINVAGTWKSATPWVNVAGTWKQATAWANVSGTWKQVGSGGVDSSELSPPTVRGSGRSPSNISVTTNAAAVSGAPSGSTFVWHIDTAGWTANNPSDAITSFTVSSLGPGAQSTANIYCTVTSGGNSHNTNTIIGTAKNTYAS